MLGGNGCRGDGLGPVDKVSRSTLHSDMSVSPVSSNDNGGPMLGLCLLHSVGSIDKVNVVQPVLDYYKLHSIDSIDKLSPVLGDIDNVGPLLYPCKRLSSDSSGNTNQLTLSM